MAFKATTTTVLYKWRDPERKKIGSIELLDQLTMETRWATATIVGPDSIIHPGDDLLMSARPVSYEFQLNGEQMFNTSDKSILGFKRDNELRATAGTILYQWCEEEEVTTESGIILVQKEATKELQPRWANVIAAGPDAGVKKGDKVLLAFKTNAYKIVVDNQELHNAGRDEVIAYETADK